MTLLSWLRVSVAGQCSLRTRFRSACFTNLVRFIHHNTISRPHLRRHDNGPGCKRCREVFEEQLKRLNREEGTAFATGGDANRKRQECSKGRPSLTPLLKRRNWHRVV